MGNFYRAFGLLMALPFQIIATFFLAQWLGNYLDMNYPRSFKWLNVAYGIGFIAILNFFIYLIIYLIKMDKKNNDK